MELVAINDRSKRRKVWIARDSYNHKNKIMNVLITGSTGFIGRATIAYLQGQGHDITALVRNVDKAANLLGHSIKLIKYSSSEKTLVEEMEKCDLVINLAGSPIATRWTAKKKLELRESRIGTTRVIVNAIKNCHNPPKILISGSAVGYYGDRGAEMLTESSKKGDGFLPELCDDWETSALEAQSTGTRVCLLRTGIVLGREGGILNTLGPMFENNIGGYIGAEQYIPWIHIYDMVKIIGECINNESLSGPINCTTPYAVTNKEFSLNLKQATKSKILIRIPTLFITLALGEATQALTNSQNVKPKVLETIEFQFQFTSLIHALRNEFEDNNIRIEKYKVEHTDTNQEREKYGIKNKGQYQLTSSILLNQDSETLFDFFSSPLNLGLLTPAWMDFHITEMPARIDSCSSIRYRIGLWFIGLNWVTKIITWTPNKLFIDTQEKGPYSLWWHEHLIIENPDGTITMKDRVIYRIPFWIFGRIAHKVLIKSTLIRIFKFRKQMIKLRF